MDKNLMRSDTGAPGPLYYPLNIVGRYFLKYKDNFMPTELATVTQDLTKATGTIEPESVSFVSANTGNSVLKNRGFVVQNLNWVNKTNAVKDLKVSQGYGLPKGIRLPDTKVVVSDETIDTANLKTIFEPAFISVKEDGSNSRSVCKGSYKLLTVAAETNPFDVPTAMGTDTMQPYIFLLLDNTSGQFNQAQAFSEFVSPFLQTGKLNSIYITKNSTDYKGASYKPGYRGQKGTAYPQKHLEGQPNPSEVNTTQHDNMLGVWEFQFAPTLDQVVGSFTEIEGKLKNGKFYKLSILPLASLAVTQNNENHENTIGVGTGIKGCIAIYQVADTEADKNDYIRVRMLKSTEEFTEAGSQGKQQLIMDTPAGLGLVAINNLKFLQIGDSDEVRDNNPASSHKDIFKVGLTYPLAHMFDITFGQTTGLTPGVSLLTKFTEEVQWESEAHTELSGHTDLPTDSFKYPVIAYPRISLNPDLVGKFEAGIDEPLDGHWDVFIKFDNAKNCLAFTLKDLRTVLQSSTATINEKWTSDDIQKMEQYPVTLEYLDLGDKGSKEWRDAFEYKRDYGTGFYSYTSLINAIKAYYKKAKGTELPSERETAYENEFKTIWGGDDVYRTPFKLQLVSSYYSETPLTLKGAMNSVPFYEPTYHLWKQQFETIQAETQKVKAEEASLTGTPTIPTEYVADIGNLVIHGASATEEEAQADFQYARVWKDLDGQEELRSGLVPDLYTLKNLYDTVYPEGTPYLDKTVNAHLRDVAYGRLKDQMPVGAWFFFYLMPEVWSVENSTIKRVFWEKGENFDKYLMVEESANPDFNCKTVSFTTIDGKIPYSYWTNPDHAKIYVSLFFCAEAENGKVTKQEFRIEIVKPVVLGVLTRTHLRSGISNDLWAYQQSTPATDGQHWYKRWINKNYGELDALDLIDHQQSLYYHCGLGVTTPRYIVYKGDEGNRIELPMIHFPANGVLNPNKSTGKLDNFTVKGSDGKNHTLRLPASYGRSFDFNQDYQGSYGTLFSSGETVGFTIGQGAISSPEKISKIKDIADNRKAAYTRCRFMIAVNNPRDVHNSLGLFTPITYRENHTEGERFKLSEDPRIETGAVNLGVPQTLRQGTEIDNNKNLYQMQWYWCETISIPVKGKNNTTVRIVRIQKEGEGFKEEYLLDNSRWQILAADFTKEWNTARKNYFIRSESAVITDVSSAIFYQLLDPALKPYDKVEIDKLGSVQEKVGAFHAYFDSFYKYWKDKEANKASVKVLWDINSRDCVNSEFILYDKDGNSVGQNYMTPSVDFVSNGNHNQWNGGNDRLENYRTPNSVHNLQTQNQVEGFQEIPKQAVIYDKENRRYFQPRSPFTKWLNNEQGLPFCKDYKRMVLMKHTKTFDSVDKMEGSWALTDSLNYELIVPKSETESPKLVRPTDGAEWNSRKQFMYDCFTYYPRCHIMDIEWTTTDVAGNFQARYRFEALSMGQFEITPDEIIKQLRGPDSTEQVQEIRTFQLDVTRFWVQDRGSLLPEGHNKFIIGSAQLPNPTNVTTQETPLNTGGQTTPGLVKQAGQNIKVSSVVHRAFVGVHAKGVNRAANNTGSPSNSVIQNTDAERFEVMRYNGYWMSSYSAQGRLNDNGFDTESNYWCAGENNKVSTAMSGNPSGGGLECTYPQTEEQRKRFELTVSGGAPSQYQSGRPPYVLRFCTDFHGWAWAHGIAQRFFGHDNVLNETVINSIAPENNQLFDLELYMWNVEFMGHLSQVAWQYNQNNAYGRWPGNDQTGWIPQNFTPIGSRDKAPHGAGDITNYRNNCSGVSSTEYSIQYAISKYPNKWGSIKHHTSPSIDLRYVNYTQDSISTSQGILCAGLTGRRQAIQPDNCEGAVTSLYRGCEIFVKLEGGYYSGTEKSFFNNSWIKFYAPYGYDQYWLSSSNDGQNHHDTGYNPNVNARISCIIADTSRVNEWQNLIQKIPGNNSGVRNDTTIYFWNSKDCYTNYDTYVYLREARGLGISSEGAVSLGGSVQVNRPVGAGNPISGQMGTGANGHKTDFSGARILAHHNSYHDQHSDSHPKSFRLNLATTHSPVSYNPHKESSTSQLQSLSPIKPV